MPKIRIKFSAVLFFCVYWLLGGNAVNRAALLAAFCHEMGHLAVMILLDFPPASITFTPFGAEILPQRPFCSYRSEMAAAAAGGLTNLTLAVLTCRIYPFFAGCNLALAAINLAPCRGLDGGRVLECFILQFAEERTAARIIDMASFFTLAVLMGAADFFLLFFQSNLSLLLLCGCLFVSAFFQPDKNSQKRTIPKHTKGYRRFGEKSQP